MIISLNSTNYTCEHTYTVRYFCTCTFNCALLELSSRVLVKSTFRQYLCHHCITSTQKGLKCVRSAWKHVPKSRSFKIYTYKPQSRFARLWLDLQCTKARSRRAPAVEKGPSRRARPLRKPPLDVQRPSPPDAQLLFPHVDINLLTVIAHIEQLQFDIGTWVT